MSLIEPELYNKILEVLPIACVDIVVLNDKQEILLLKRKNDPAKGEWWFPGGRILKGEPRSQSVRRILLQECGITADVVTEFQTCELFQEPKHGITTVFTVRTSAAGNGILLDEQSSGFKWLAKGDATDELHEFVSEIINKVRG